MKTTRMNFIRRNRKKRKYENVGYMEIKDAAMGAGVDLYIYGDIVSTEWDKWSSEDICPQDIVDFLKEIDDDAALTVYINSGGGDVFAGIGICNILKRHKGHIRGVVDGIAASIASVILMACDDIVVSTGAQIMIHKPMTVGFGNADKFAQLISQLDKCQQMITDIYMEKAKEGVEEETITEMINKETWMSGNEAAEFFDVELEEREAVAACISYMKDRFANMPEIKTESVEDADEKKRKAEIENILEDLDLYGI